MDRGELQRLVEAVARQILTARGELPRGEPSETGLLESCPARLRAIVEARPLADGGERPSEGNVDDVAALIDHTLLRPDAVRADVERLCSEAWEHRFAAVCVNPAWVALVARKMENSGVAICSVVGFPLGATTADAKRYETLRAIDDGAAEIDMVVNIGALKSGDSDVALEDIEAVTRTCRDYAVVSKVIIETARLTDDEKILACQLSKAAGADFVKTSTGFGPGGATAADVSLIRRIVGETMGLKASGGIKDYRTMMEMVAAGATRIGTSSGVAIVAEARSARGEGLTSVRRTE
jgi:deoxyribose-phosphate aldolase